MRNLFILCFFLLNWLIAPVTAQEILQKPLSERLTNYQIEASLDTQQKLVQGTMILTYRNPSSDTLHELLFHMYMNAFRNDYSRFFSERRPAVRDSVEYGYIRVISCFVRGEDRTQTLQFTGTDQWGPENPAYIWNLEPPDSAFTDTDLTIMRLPLKQLLLPDSTISVRMKFEVKLPKLTSRSGYSKDYFFVAQWFPKLAVYEPAGMRGRTTGGWNAHQFHANSEFYADPGTYVVKITLPESYQVGSCGLLVHEQSDGAGNKSLTFRGEDIVDFAWTAGKRFMVAEDQWQHIHIRCLMQPEHYRQADRYIKAVKYAMQYFNDHVGTYPWPYLTIVDPPTSGQSSGGMEYTTMITTGTAYDLPRGLRLPEVVTIHEFGHAYFMGMLATNEFEEPWMDEGINTYFETRIMDWAYGEKQSMADFPFARLGDGEFCRISYLDFPARSIVPTYNNSWSFPHGSYGVLSYQKPATMMRTLERLIGRDCMDQVFKTYYRRWAFKHPSSQDFIDIVNEVVALCPNNLSVSSMNWFFNQFLFDTREVDYRVRDILISSEIQKGGWFGRKRNLSYHPAEKHHDHYISVVRLERLGDGVIPLDVMIGFNDGTTVIERWDGKEKYHDFKYIGSRKVLWAQIDPDQKILLDTNMMNNSLSLKPHRKLSLKWGTKFLFFIQNLMQITAIFS